MKSTKNKPYYAFGLAIHSDWDIPCLQVPHASFETIHIRQATESFFRNAVPSGLRHPYPKRPTFHQLADGSRYLLWRDVFEFHLSADAREVHGRSLDGRPEAAFRTYMMGHLLSYVLLGLGLETLHAATVVFDGEAVGFLGDSARGKSTLAAACLQAGAQLLSDDFLVLREERGRLMAYPGFPRIKLYERVSQHLMAPGKKGVPMNQDPCPKIVFPMENALASAVPLKAFYALASPRAVMGLQEVWIQPLTEREAYLELTENAFNLNVQTRERLASQFQWATNLVKRIAVKRLAYPRLLTILPEVIAQVRADLQREKSSLNALPATRLSRNA